jgi:hypothetical protein
VRPNNFDGSGEIEKEIGCRRACHDNSCSHHLKWVCSSDVMHDYVL